MSVYIQTSPRLLTLCIALTVTLSAAPSAMSQSQTKLLDPFNLSMPKEIPIQKYPGSKIVSVTDSLVSPSQLSGETKEDRVWCAFTSPNASSVLDFYRRWLANNRWSIDYDIASGTVGSLQASRDKDRFELDYSTAQPTVQFFLSGIGAATGSLEVTAPFPQYPGSVIQSNSRKSQALASRQASTPVSTPTQTTVTVEQVSSDPRHEVLEYYKTKLQELGWNVTLERWKSLEAITGTTVLRLKYDENNPSKFVMTLTK